MDYISASIHRLRHLRIYIYSPRIDYRMTSQIERLQKRLERLKDGIN